MKHHARTAETLFSSEDVVPGDEEIRASGERSTTPSPLKPCSGDVVPGDEGIRASGR